MPSVEEILKQGRAMQAKKTGKRSVPSSGRRRVVINAVTATKKSPTLEEVQEKLASMPIQESVDEKLEIGTIRSRKRRRLSSFDELSSTV